MDNREKTFRCENAKTRETNDINVIQCKVYSRWVSNCDDCSFSIWKGN